jgi:flagella basal body P-ring formation protein FlgA
MKLAVLLFMGLFLPAVIACVDSAWSAASPINEIRILKNIFVNQKEVSLLEICDTETLSDEWKSIMGGLNIGEAPPVESEKFIDPGQLRTYLDDLLDSNGINPSEVRIDIPEKIVVKRQSTQVTQEWIEEIFKKFIFENSPWNREDINIQRVRFSGVPLIPTGKMTYDVKAYSSRERFIGNVTATVDLYVNEEKVRTLSVAGKVDVYATVYHASRPLKQNEMISVADLEVHKMNITDAADRFATHPDQVENRRALRNIGVHQPLELKDLDKLLVLKRGDPVKIVYEEPGLSVTAKGQANADASVGDTLAVINVSSNKTVYCKVVDARTVRAVH